MSSGKIQNLLVSLGLFLLALLPRAYDLQRFITADEAKWVYRSAQFLAACLRGDWAATSVNLTPAVTTTWLGSLGLWVYYIFHRAALDLPLADWLVAIPEFRPGLALLVATRWPVVIFTSLGVVAFYWLVRRLFAPDLALVAALLVALDPHTVALSRVIGHDAPTAALMSLSLLLALWAGRAGWPALVLSGLAAGLAFLSKAPAFFLVPFVTLLLTSRSRAGLAHLLVWGVVAYLTFITFWPAAWVEPLGRPLAVIENAFLSATDGEEAGAENYWLVPDLGLAYYPVNGGFKLSPLVMVGVALAVVGGISREKPNGESANGESANQRVSESASQRISESANGESVNGEWDAKHGESASQRVSESASKEPFNLQPPRPSEGQSNLLWLLAFVLLFTVFLAASDKRSPRYLLPAFPILAVLAAFGWLYLYRLAAAKMGLVGNSLALGRRAFTGLLALSALVILLPVAPYYFTYFNPLLGGAYTAPSLVKIGWGEGLDQVGRFLQRETARDSRVGTTYASTIAPYFEGELVDVTADRLDYVVLYSKLLQAGEPSPSFIRYFEAVGPIFSAELNGIRYAGVYAGPALQPALALTPGLDHAILPKPTGFRPLTSYGRIGEPLEVDVVWLADDPLPAEPSTVTLEPATAFDFLAEDNHEDGTARVGRQITVLAGGAGRLVRHPNGLVVSRHRLEVPADLARGEYALLIDERPLGRIDLRSFTVPPDLGRVDGFVFDDQITLAGYGFEPTADYIRLTLAWQARQSRLPDYTVFAQLLDSETGERVAGVDAPPLQGAWPTSRWVRDEVVVDEMVLALPPGLAPGSYQVIVGLYQPEDGRRLILPGGQDFWPLPWTYLWKG